MPRHSSRKGRRGQNDTALPPKKGKEYCSFGAADTSSLPRCSSRHNIISVDTQKPNVPVSTVDSGALASHVAKDSLSPNLPPFLQVPSTSDCLDPVSIIPAVPSSLLPDKSPSTDHPSFTRGVEDEEVICMGEVKRRIMPLQDYPHFHFQCGTEKGKKNSLQTLRFCRNCFCFVCDVRASECKQWNDHAHAVDEYHWRNKRNLRRRLRDL